MEKMSQGKVVKDYWLLVAYLCAHGYLVAVSVVVGGTGSRHYYYYVFI